MPARRKSRQRALQVLFFADMRKQEIGEAIEAYYPSLFTAEMDELTGEESAPPPEGDAFMESLAGGTFAQREMLDELIARKAEHWRLDRMPLVDRNILRMAIYEMKDLGTPPAVVIDEALELARRYSEEEAIPFINGVLDSIRKLLDIPLTSPPQ
ncbi:MAG: transcription antitermination factor NusB [Candidatus Solibacter sp.]|nr:transcription antitermination factor NusB [Candidatus Solibacter sp.]